MRAQFDGELVQEMAETTAREFADWCAGRKPYLWHGPFALVAGAIATQNRIRVVDFGGGTGTGFVQLVSSLPASIAIEYVVVDTQVVCEAGRRVYAEEPRIQFVTDNAKLTGPIDLVYVNSVLQYTDDYAGALKHLTDLQPRYLFLARLAAGEAPRFASAQVNVPGRLFPHWFLNMSEVVARMAALGYQLSCDSFVDATYDQSNLPPTHRVERFRNVLFARTADR